MAFDLIAIATAAASAGAAEVARRLLGRRHAERPEPEPGSVSFGDVRAGGAVTQSGRDVTIHHGRRE